MPTPLHKPAAALSMCSLCGAIVKNLSVHQRTHRDGIKISSETGGVTKLYRSSSGNFQCPGIGCTHSGSNSNSIQRHIKRCRFQHPAAGVEPPYPTPASTARPSSSIPEEDTIMVDEIDDEIDTMSDDDALMGGVEFDQDVGGSLLDALEADDDDDKQDGDDEQNGVEDYIDDSSDDDDDDDGDGPNVPTDDGSTQVPVVEWSADMVQTDAMASVGIAVNTRARVIICLACRQAIQPNRLYDHIRRHAPMRLPLHACDTILGAYDLIQNPAKARPTTKIAAVYGLDLVSGYLACGSCGYACRSDPALQRHRVRRTRCTRSSFGLSYAQTFTPSSGRMYFAVDVTASASMEVDEGFDPVTHLKQKYAPVPFQQLAITSPQNPRDSNHFLQLEKWGQFVNGKTGEEIREVVRERKPDLRSQVRLCVNTYAKNLSDPLTSEGHGAQVAIGDYTGVGFTTSKLQDLQNTKTRDQYCKVGTDFIVFCLGVVTGDVKGYEITYPEEFAVAGRRLLAALHSATVEPRIKALQNFLYLLFTQIRPGGVSKHSILPYSFLILFAYNVDGTLKPCDFFSQDFSKVIFFARAAMFNSIMDICKAEDRGFYDVYESHKPYLSLSSDYPLSAIYQTKNLAKKLSKDQIRNVKVDLVGVARDVIVMGSITMRIDGFGVLYRKLLEEITQMQEDLFGGIGFNDEEWIKFERPAFFKDETNSIRAGFNFGELEENGMSKYADAGLRVLFDHPRLRDRYGCQAPGGGFVLNAVGCHDFLARADLIRSKLSTAAHISVGGPARGTETAANYLRNHPQGDLRNVLIVFGQVCFVAGYNKTTSCTERQKKIFRFLPKSLEALFLIEWFVIRPTEIVLAAALGMEAAVEELRFKLYPGIHRPFESETLAKNLKRDTELHLGQQVGISDYRDIQTIAVRYHNDPEEYTGMGVGVTADMQRGHSSETAQAAYGTSSEFPQGVGIDKIKRYNRASRWWQDLTGIEPLEPAPTNTQVAHDHNRCGGPDPRVGDLVDSFADLRLGMRADIMDIVACAFAMEERKKSASAASPSLGSGELYLPHPSLLTLLARFFGDPKAKFKTPQQAEALEVVLSRNRHVLLVGPTAMGKSLVYMLPSRICHPKMVTCSELNLECSRWTPRLQETPKTSVVFVSPEDAVTAKFLNYVIQLHTLKLLARIVIDEAHLVKLHSDFRYCLQSLKPLIRTKVPFLLMTATCPPSLRPELFSCLGLSDVLVIHAPTDRPEISYSVTVGPTLLEDSKPVLVDTVRKFQKHFGQGSSRGLVYCRSHEDVEEIARLIGCEPFHAGRPLEERETNFKNWVDGEQSFMVCSSLLGCGIDVDNVRVVMHYGTPWSILDFVQESGRAGRGGLPSWSYVFASDDEMEPSGDDLYGKQTMRKWVLQRTDCRRTILSSFLDEGRISCTLLKQAHLCDVCKEQSKQPHPDKLVPFPSPKFPNQNGPKIRVPHIPPSSIQYARDRSTALAPETAVASTSAIEPEQGDSSELPPKITGAREMLMAKAKEAVLEANKALAPDAASISATTDAWGSAVDTMMDNLMVQDIRENLDMIIGGCSICYMLAGEVNMEHESGGLCPTVPLDESNKVWEGFRKSLRLPGGIVCFKCLLPSNSKANGAGGSFHHCAVCPQPHLIRPVIFTFFEHGRPELKAYLAGKVEVGWNKGFPEYKKWVEKNPGSSISNFLKMYWWILVYFGRLDYMNGLK